MQERELTVTILGKPYSLVGDFDPKLLQESAEKVDSVMNELQKSNPYASPGKLAVLTSLKMAFQMEQVKMDCLKGFNDISGWLEDIESSFKVSQGTH